MMKRQLFYPWDIGHGCFEGWQAYRFDQVRAVECSVAAYVAAPGRKVWQVIVTMVTDQRILVVEVDDETAADREVCSFMKAWDRALGGEGLYPWEGGAVT